MGVGVWKSYSSTWDLAEPLFLWLPYFPRHFHSLYVGTFFIFQFSVPATGPDWESNTWANPICAILLYMCSTKHYITHNRTKYIIQPYSTINHHHIIYTPAIMGAISTGNHCYHFSFGSTSMVVIIPTVWMYKLSTVDNLNLSLTTLSPTVTVGIQKYIYHYKYPIYTSI